MSLAKCHATHHDCTLRCNDFDGMLHTRFCWLHSQDACPGSRDRLGCMGVDPQPRWLHYVLTEEYHTECFDGSDGMHCWCVLTVEVYETTTGICIKYLMVDPSICIAAVICYVQSRWPVYLPNPTRLLTTDLGLPFARTRCGPVWIR